MTDNAPQESKKFSAFLAVSLALNAALIGLIGGQMLVDSRNSERSYMGRDGHRPPMEHVLNVMSEDERKAMKKTMIQHWKNSHAERKVVRQMHDQVIEAIKVEPFERVNVETALEKFEQADSKIKSIAESGVLDVMEGMSPEARVVLAETLLLKDRMRSRESRCEGEGCKGRKRGDGEGDFRRHDRPPPPRDGRPDEAPPQPLDE